MSDYFDLKDKVAVVTGGTSGIGLEVAKRFRDCGAHVVIAGRRDGTAIADEIGATFCQTDVSDEGSVANLMQMAHDTYGPIDAVINCAGVNRGYETLLEQDAANFDFNYSINTMGVVFGIKHGVPLMNEGGGSIVNVSSVAGLEGVPFLAPYVASKWAAVGITKTAALELGGKNIRVNAICPTSVDTPMARAKGGEAQLAMEHMQVPMSRIAQPSEVAALVHFLVADDCSFVNGQAIAVDGGFGAGVSVDSYEALAEAGASLVQPHV
ncbi:MAG: SDR family oxidoreductase [Acidimicrobiia bacterium]|nr:SDR family oxidoreductase [Acidimicrobiia bacterium]